MNLEELYKRKKKGPKEKEQFEWEPERPNHDWTLPNFDIKIPKSNNGLASTREGLSKILTFIKNVQRKRFKDGATVMPISTHSALNLQIWNSSKGVSNAIDKMIEYGLLQIDNALYRFSDTYKNESYCKTYLYFVDNEKKIIEYCKENGIKAFEIKSAKGFSSKPFKKVETKNIGFNFEKEDVRFSNDLILDKPEGLSNTEFEEILSFLQMLQEDIHKL